MVAGQLEARGIFDRRVLDAMASVPREAFVFESDRKRAYLDMPLRIGFGQTISQPYMVAIICQTADVHEGDRVLDIGTGSGYQAAVLAELGAQVHTIERIPELADRAQARLEAAGYGSVDVHVGDGSLGLPGARPLRFDRRRGGRARRAGLPLRGARSGRSPRRAGRRTERPAARGDRREPGGTRRDEIGSLPIRSASRSGGLLGRGAGFRPEPPGNR